MYKGYSNPYTVLKHEVSTKKKKPKKKKKPRSKVLHTNKAQVGKKQIQRKRIGKKPMIVKSDSEMLTIHILRMIFEYLVLPVNDPYVKPFYEEWKKRDNFDPNDGYYDLHPISARHVHLRQLAQTCRYFKNQVGEYRDCCRNPSNTIVNRKGRKEEFNICRIEKQMTIQCSKTNRRRRREKRNAKKMIKYRKALPLVFKEIHSQFRNSNTYYNTVEKKCHYSFRGSWTEDIEAADELRGRRRLLKNSNGKEFVEYRKNKGAKWFEMATISRKQMFGELTLEKIVFCKQGKKEEYFWVQVSRYFSAKVKFHDKGDSLVFTVRLGKKSGINAKDKENSNFASSSMYNNYSNEW